MKLYQECASIAFGYAFRLTEAGNKVKLGQDVNGWFVQII